MASILREKVITKEKIEMMFRIIERISSNKKVTGDSLFSIFGLKGQIDKTVFASWVKKFDKEENGELDLSQFKSMI